MHKEGDEIHVETDEVRGGSSSGVVRWVLVIGTLVAIVLLTITWMTGAALSVGDEAVGDAVIGDDPGDVVIGEELETVEDDLGSDEEAVGEIAGPVEPAE